TDEWGIRSAGMSSAASATIRDILETRKYNAAKVVLAQTTEQVQSITPEIEGLAGMTMVGKLDGASAKAAVEGISKLEKDHGFHKALTGAKSGEWLITDWRGRTQF